jgi:selenocysteine lyase/cysteine desulfurase
MDRREFAATGMGVAVGGAMGLGGRMAPAIYNTEADMERIAEILAG